METGCYQGFLEGFELSGQRLDPLSSVMILVITGDPSCTSREKASEHAITSNFYPRQMRIFLCPFLYLENI